MQQQQRAAAAAAERRGARAASRAAILVVLVVLVVVALNAPTAAAFLVPTSLPTVSSRSSRHPFSSSTTTSSKSRCQTTPPPSRLLTTMLAAGSSPARERVTLTISTAPGGGGYTVRGVYYSGGVQKESWVLSKVSQLANEMTRCIHRTHGPVTNPPSTEINAWSSNNPTTPSLPSPNHHHQTYDEIEQWSYLANKRLGYGLPPLPPKDLCTVLQLEEFMNKAVRLEPLWRSQEDLAFFAVPKSLLEEEEEEDATPAYKPDVYDVVRKGVGGRGRGWGVPNASQRTWEGRIL